MNSTEIIIEGNIYNTKQEKHRRYLGLHEEKKFLTFLINNQVNVKHVSDDNVFSPYDFIIEKDDIIYIIELKSRLGNISNHNIEYMSLNKINKYKKICKNDKKKIECMFVFNHIDVINGNEYGGNNYYYYTIDFDKVDDICFRTIKDNSETLELPVRYLRKLEVFIALAARVDAKHLAKQAENIK